MATFEVFVPVSEGSREIIIREEGPNWFCALESALSSLGMADNIKNIMCDIQENGDVHIADIPSGKKFVVKELKSAEIVEQKEKPEQREKKAEEQVINFQEKKKEKPQITKKDEMLAELFTDVMDAWGLTDDEISSFFLDLALKYVPSESGSYAKSDLNSSDLEFVVCRGPKGSDVCGIKVKVGQGLVGFSAKHSCYIAVSDVNKDPRFFKEISEKIEYQTTSIACIPVKSAESNITFGVLEVINKESGNRYSEDDFEVLRFISEKMAELLHSRWISKDNALD
ncbi:MAG: GAF domain-containing protein [bacterium]